MSQEAGDMPGIMLFHASVIMMIIGGREWHMVSKRVGSIRLVGQLNRGGEECQHDDAALSGCSDGLKNQLVKMVTSPWCRW
jgi:hypothetical protein